MSYDGAGSLFALGMRLTKLASDGSLLPGPQNSYTTDALITLQLGLEYEAGDEITQKNGAGRVCLTYKAPDTLKRGTIKSLQVCDPDPNVLQFLMGGRVLERGGAQVGYQAPEVGEDPTPNGVSVEVWTRAIINGAQVGYFWWVIPRAQLTPSKEWELSGSNPMVPELDGTCTQNDNWLDGPNDDWEFQSERVWQFAETATIPDLTPAFHAVSAQPTVASLAITPSSPTVVSGSTVQLTATATLTPSGTQDVTSAANWSTSDATKATVNSAGLVTGVAAGTATITAVYGGQTATKSVTVS
jgi:uncharacterized protein YjdB